MCRSIGGMFFIECNCHQNGSINSNCDNVGKCTCKMGFDGVKCDTCAKGFSGENCEKCNDGFYGYPNCQGRFFKYSSSGFLGI